MNNNVVNKYIDSSVNRTISNIQAHPYHLVEPSPWPIFTAFSLFGLAFNTALVMHSYIPSPYIMPFNLITLIYSMSLWGRDIISEATYEGHHTLAVRNGIFTGYVLFILSEAMFFFGVFWAYGHSSLNPNIEIGAMWPPIGITAIGPLELPLFNTIVLLSSGATITYSHHALIANNWSHAVLSLLITVLLAILFTVCQYIEYVYSTFTISDGVYGSCFYFGTGLHGTHIIVGIIFLSLSLWRLYSLHYTDTHHVGYETTILLWHFLDVVWLFLFVVFYWWGS